MFEGRPVDPDVRSVIAASRGSAKTSRQKPAAAGPVVVSRTRIGESPITQAPNSNTATACQRGCVGAVSAKTQLPANLRRGHTAGAEFAQRLGLVALGVAPAVGAGEQAVVAVGRDGETEQ